MTYPLLDHVNRRNAAELARVVNLSAAELVRVESLEWAPTTEEVRTRSGRSLGRGDKIRCGESIDGDIADFGSQRGHTYKRESWNVCRPFDETYHDHVRNMRPLLSDLADFSLKEFAKSTTHHTPPNHGHGAVCGCAVRELPEGAIVDVENLFFNDVSDPFGPRQIRHAGIRAFVKLPGHKQPIQLTPDANGKLLERRGDVTVAMNWPDPSCHNCAGTGRLICDDERAGRVSPSHAAGGYEEWQRRTMESAVAVRSGARQIGRITNMRSVDGFVVGDIELADGSVVVERLMAER